MGQLRFFARNHARAKAQAARIKSRDAGLGRPDFKIVFKHQWEKHMKLKSFRGAFK